MRRYYLRGLLACALLVLGVAEAKALRIAMPIAQSTMQKVMASEVILVGKVSAIEKESVELEPGPKQPKIAYSVASIKIETSLLGAKNITHAKVLFPKPADGTVKADGPIEGAPLLPGRPIRPGGGGFQPITLTEGQEGLFFLQKHPSDAGYFIIQQGHNPIAAADANYKDELEKVKASTLAFADPVKALSVEKLEQRLPAAMALATRYRMYPPNNVTGVVEEVELPGEESKLIVKALLEADWTKTDAPKLADLLGLVPGQYGLPEIHMKDGETMAEVRQTAFKAWHEKFGSKYSVKRLVAKTK
jgi:hypothetical protein